MKTTTISLGEQILTAIMNNLHVQTMSDQDIWQIKFELYNALKQEIDSLR